MYETVKDEVELAIRASESLQKSPGWEYLRALLEVQQERDVSRLLNANTNHDETQYLRGRLSALDLFLSGPERIIEQARAAAEEAEKARERDPRHFRKVPRGI
jgi:hypothetical protein